MPAAYPYPLFARTGIELEYAIVDRRTLEVLPVADRLLRAISGNNDGEVVLGPVAWSNELVLHVVELKTERPIASLDGLEWLMHDNVRRIDSVLAPLNGRLMPTAMHPWMDPARQMKLWPHGYNEVYAAFDRIFDCRGHGWANLQSMHINLPFADDAEPDGEFGRLHAAIRVLLPILPALAASSPIVEGRITGTLDTRLAVYATNARRVPSVAGRVIPEPAFTRADYERTILEPIYRDLAPHDPAGILRHEWANARGCIARFDRGSIEVRVLDVQECPRADIAIARAVAAATRALVGERWSTLREQQAAPTAGLADLFQAAVRDADRAVIADPAYLALFGVRAASLPAGELWAHLLHQLGDGVRDAQGQLLEPLQLILSYGPLARRIIRATGPEPDRPTLAHHYRRLADCLADNHLFT